MDAQRRQPRSAARCALWACTWGAIFICALDAAHAAGDAVVAAPLLLSPTQGRPVIVEPGKTFPVFVQFPDTPPELEFALVAAGFPTHRHGLTARPVAEDTTGPGARFALALPEDLPEKTYDLLITGGGATMRARHAVAVRRATRRIRIVHLSDMNVGELGVPAFDERLIHDVNLFAPTLIVATGDYLDALHADREAGWQQLSDWLARFDAPVLAACGDHDDVALYSRYLAPSPVGEIQVGAYHGLVLYDLPAKPMLDDPEQLAWAERALVTGDHELGFIIAHDECPNLLRHWQQQGTLADMLRGGRLGLWLAGGHREWDGREFRELIDAARPMVYLRTRQASPATRDGAPGTSHFRVVDLEGQRAVFYGEPGPDGRAGSIPVGRVQATWDGPNDGSRTQVACTVVSTLPFRAEHLRIRAFVRRDSGERPWCLGGRLERVITLPTLWECHVACDLPDKGVARIAVGTGAPPVGPDVDVEFLMPPDLPLQPVINADGVSYLTVAGGWVGLVQLQNMGAAPATVAPLVRLDGETLGYRVVEEPGPVASAYTLRLMPHQVLTLQLDLSACRIAPGRRELQVYLEGGPACAPVTTPLQVTILR